MAFLGTRVVPGLKTGRLMVSSVTSVGAMLIDLIDAAQIRLRTVFGWHGNGWYSPGCDLVGYQPDQGDCGHQSGHNQRNHGGSVPAQYLRLSCATNSYELCSLFDASTAIIFTRSKTISLLTRVTSVARSATNVSLHRGIVRQTLYHATASSLIVSDQHGHCPVTRVQGMQPAAEKR